MPAKPTLPANPTLHAETAPTMVSTTVTTQTPVAKSAATTTTSILVTAYNLAQGNFKGIPYPTRKPQEDEGPSAPCCNNPQEEQQPEDAQNREDIPWPNTIPVSMNLFDARASWPILPNDTSTVKMEKAEEKIPPKVAAIPYVLVLNKPQSNKPAEEECRWGLHCPICTNPLLI